MIAFLVDSKFLPWRLARRIDVWREGWLRENWPAAYRLWRFGRLADLVEPLTHGPEHHFFGYYDKTPWNRRGDLVLTHSIGFGDRAPGSSDPATIAVVDLADNKRVRPIAQTLAWNWQQGAMLQWHPVEADELVLHNDRDGNRFIGVVRTINGEIERVYERPFYAVDPAGRFALSLSFSRLHFCRPGYGYPGADDAWTCEPRPKDDGIHIFDLASGRSELALSIDQLARNEERPDMTESWHWVNHIQTSKGGRRFAFLHRWGPKGAHRRTRLYVADVDGSDLQIVLEGRVSHYDWLDDETLLVWNGSYSERGAFLLCNVSEKSQSVVGQGVLTEDGHCSFSADGRWILNDTYPDRYGLRTLMLFHLRDGKRVDLARLMSAPELRGEVRCDLHPRWSRDNQFVCIDSAHTGERQMYLVDIRRILR